MPIVRVAQPVGWSVENFSFFLLPSSCQLLALSTSSLFKFAPRTADKHSPPPLTWVLAQCLLCFIVNTWTNFTFPTNLLAYFVSNWILKLSFHLHIFFLFYPSLYRLVRDVRDRFCKCSQVSVNCFNLNISRLLLK